MSRCVIRNGIGLCDDCGLEKWPQEYMGYGIMICLDCKKKAEDERAALRARRRTRVEVQR